MVMTTKPKIKYIAKDNSPFDSGTELTLLDDYRFDHLEAGLFEGKQKGNIIKQYCSFSQIDVVKELY